MLGVYLLSICLFALTVCDLQVCRPHMGDHSAVGAALLAHRSLTAYQLLTSPYQAMGGAADLV